jgi:hypothetical protein
MTQSILRLYSVNDRMTDKSRVGGGMRIGKGNYVLGETTPQLHFVHRKSHGLNCDQTWAMHS